MASSIDYHVTFPSAGRPPLSLEGLYRRLPQQEGDAPRAGIVICHPQPAASSMDDTLCARLAADLATAGLPVLRFNFRGVGASRGQQSDGRLEPLDIAGAVEFLLAQPEVDADKLALVGHAFGAYVALAYADHDPRVRTVVAVSPPMFRVTPGLGAFDRPKLFVTGEYDEVSPRHKLEPWLAQLPNCALRVVTGARHLMRGYEDVASASIVKYLTKWAATPGI